MAIHDDDDNDQTGDIEKQLLHSPLHHELSPPNSATTTVTKDPTASSTIVVDHDNDKDDDKASLENAPAPRRVHSFFIKMVKAFFKALKSIAIILCFCLVYPFLAAYAICSICITGDIKEPNECFSSQDEGDDQAIESKSKGIYKKMQDLKSIKEKIWALNLITTTRLGCVALLWLVVNLTVPGLTRVTLFGYLLWKWALLAVVILLGYPFTSITTNVLFMFVHDGGDREFSKHPSFVYFLKGLENSLAALLHFVSILLLWLLYFRTDHGFDPSKRVDKFGTWTFVSFLVGAVLWVVKSATLLEWNANAVYKRFKGRILMAGFQLYFLSKIIGNLPMPWLLPWRGDDIEDQPTQPSTLIISDGAAKDSKNQRIQDYMLSKLVSVDRIELVARYVTDLAKVTLRENDGIPEILAKCREKIPTDDLNTMQYMTKETLEKNFGLNEDDAQLLLQELKGEQLADEITYDAFEKWIVDSHKNCLSVGYTLLDAFAVVSVLSRVIIGFIVAVVVLVWLLLTGLATTTVLVLIASPFLAISFVFGDTCKTFFQGIIFSFVTHPYDVGDRCIIDQMELEVKRISILTTTFVKIGTKEKVLHPNTSLATKVIINLEGEPDPTDMIELILDSSTTMSKILSLKKELESFFENIVRRGSYEKTIHVEVKEIGSSIKVRISFTHVMNVQDVTHSQCLQKKNKQQSELLIDIKQFLENLDIKLATP